MTDSWLIRTIRAHKAEYDAWRVARHPRPQIGPQSSRNGTYAPVSSSAGLPETAEEDSRLSLSALETTEIDADELADRIAMTTNPLRIDGRGGNGLSDGVALQSASHPTTTTELRWVGTELFIGRLNVGCIHQIPSGEVGGILYTGCIANDFEPDIICEGKSNTEAMAIVESAVRKELGCTNPCAKIFTHKWLDPQCVEDGCQSIALWAKHNSAVTTGERAYLDGVRDGLEQAFRIINANAGKFPETIRSIQSAIDDTRES